MPPSPPVLVLPLLQGGLRRARSHNRSRALMMATPLRPTPQTMSSHAVMPRWHPRVALTPKQWYVDCMSGNGLYYLMRFSPPPPSVTCPARSGGGGGLTESMANDSHVPLVPSIEYCKREESSSITGGNFGGYPARCVRDSSVGSLPPFQIRLGTTPGKPLGSFGSQLEPQNATNNAWNVLGTTRPRFHGTLGRNFGGICGT